DWTRFAYEKAEMGLPFRVTLYAPDEAAAKAASDAAFERIAQLNQVFSDYDPDSELSRLSRTHDQAVPVSDDLWNVLVRSQALAEKTGGAFDITVGPLVNLWRRVRRKRELPAPGLLAEMKSRVGYQNLVLDPNARTALLRHADMRLDCGGIAKGYAIDAALRTLQQRGFRQALVGGGGDMAAGAAPPGRDGWRIELAPPDIPDAPQTQTIVLCNSAIATSGDTFQNVVIDGVKYSHIVDPKTGLGLVDYGLVTVLAPDGTTADSLATAVSVLDFQKGKELMAAAGKNVSARIIRRMEGKTEVQVTKGWPASSEQSGAEREQSSEQ
ncbi:MAG: FAD:protein FMN transferase, partial [Chthoniobacteraceae bacterium]